MRLAELLKVFALDMPVVALNAGAASLNRLSDRIQSPAHGWPDIPWAGVIAVSDREDDATGSWASAFQILSEPDTNPAAVVFVVEDGPEELPRRHLAEMSRDQGWTLELALNLDYAMFPIAILAIPETGGGAQEVVDLNEFILSHGGAKQWERDTVLRQAARVDALEREVTRANLAAKASKELYKIAKNSSAYRLGILLGRSARNPLKAIVDLPVGIAEIARDRDKTAAQAERARRALAEADDSVAERQERTRPGWAMSDVPITRLHHGDRMAPSSSLPLVAHVSHPSLGGLRRPPWAIDLSPNDCLDSVERDLPAAIVIDSAAFLAGSPWAGGGTGEDPHKTNTVLNLMSRAEQYGIPTVFRWLAAPESMPSLIRLANLCSFSVKGSGGTNRPRSEVLQQGVRLEQWPPIVGAPSDFVVAMFASAQLPAPSRPSRESGLSPAHPRLSETIRLTRIQPGTTHNVGATQAVLDGVSIASFPRFDGLPLVAAEVSVMGLAVIGSASRQLSVLSPVDDTVWDEARINAAATSAYQSMLHTRWNVLRSRSTISETRALGELVGHHDLARVGSLSAVVVADTDNDSKLDPLSELAGDIDTLHLSSPRPQTNGAETMIQRLKQTRGKIEFLAGWFHTARAVRRLTARAGRVWLTSLSELGNDSVAEMRRAMTWQSTSGKSGMLVGASQTVGLDDHSLAHWLELQHARLTEPGR